MSAFDPKRHWPASVRCKLPHLRGGDFVTIGGGELSCEEEGRLGEM
jgi:hypothetical protein